MTIMPAWSTCPTALLGVWAAGDIVDDAVIRIFQSSKENKVGNETQRQLMILHAHIETRQLSVAIAGLSSKEYAQTTLRSTNVLMIHMMQFQSATHPTSGAVCVYQWLLRRTTSPWSAFLLQGFLREKVSRSRLSSIVSAGGAQSPSEFYLHDKSKQRQ